MVYHHLTHGYPWSITIYPMVSKVMVPQVAMDVKPAQLLSSPRYASTRPCAPHVENPMGFMVPSKRLKGDPQNGWFLMENRSKIPKMVGL